MHVIISRGTHPYNETFTLMEMWSVCVWEEEAKFTYIQHGATESSHNRQPESESPSNKRQRADWKCLIHNLTNHSQSANIWKDLPCYQTKLSPTVGQSHRSHDTESISSLAALYNSSLFTHCCLLSINVGSSSNNVPSCAPWIWQKQICYNHYITRGTTSWTCSFYLLPLFVKH